MKEIRIVIVYSNELESIFIDGVELSDISEIQDKPIKEWFLPANNRSGWEGLIPEIQKIVNDESAKLNFEFQGPQEYKGIFEDCLNKLGFSSNTEGLSKEEVAKINLKDAKKAENRGFYKKAFQYYINAADYGKSAEAEFIVGKYYEKYANGEIDISDISKEEAYANMIEYYEKAANKDYIEAQYELFRFLWEGKLIKKNEGSALYWLKELHLVE